MAAKTYHYCALAQQTPLDALSYSDGFITVDWDLCTTYAQAELRKAIGERMVPPTGRPIILSLTVVAP